MQLIKLGISIFAPIVLNYLVNKFYADEEQQKHNPLVASLVVSPFSIACGVTFNCREYGLDSMRENVIFSSVSALGSFCLYKAMTTKPLIFILPALLAIGLQCYWNFCLSTSYLDID